MEVTIYGDVIFLINFCMDFMILWITAVLEKNICYKRILLGSLFLSLMYCLALCFPIFSFFAVLLNQKEVTLSDTRRTGKRNQKIV